MRPGQDDLDRLARRSTISGTPRTTLAERYLREGLLMDEFPGIHFVDGALGRRAALIGHRLDVWEVTMVALEHSMSVPETASALEIDARVVQIALAYYGEQRSEVDAFIARVDAFNEAEEARWRAVHGAGAA
jgi:hypothetical protein